VAITNIILANPAGFSEYTDTVMGATVDAVKGSSTALYQVVIDNSANAGAAAYVKLYNLASGSVTVGTTVPDEVIFVPGGAIVTQPYFTKAAPGKTFATALTAACVTAGGTAGTTPPTNPVIVNIVYA
jgi:hypothetical protein